MAFTKECELFSEFAVTIINSEVIGGGPLWWYPRGISFTNEMMEYLVDRPNPNKLSYLRYLSRMGFISHEQLRHPSNIFHIALQNGFFNFVSEIDSTSDAKLNQKTFLDSFKSALFVKKLPVSQLSALFDCSNLFNMKVNQTFRPETIDELLKFNTKMFGILVGSNKKSWPEHLMDIATSWLSLSPSNLNLSSNHAARFNELGCNILTIAAISTENQISLPEKCWNNWIVWTCPG